MTLFRRLMFALLSGALLGTVVATAISAKFITWYNEPGAGQALCPCTELSKNAVGHLITGQLIGAGAGAVVFMVLTGIFFRGPKHPASPAEPPSAPAA